MIFFFIVRRDAAKQDFLEHIKRGLNPKYDLCISKIERLTLIFVGEGTTKSRHLKVGGWRMGDLEIKIEDGGL